MRGYPVNRDELFGLGGVGLGATLCFSGGFSWLTRSSDITRDVDFAKIVAGERVPEKWVARWEAKAESDFFIGVGLIFAGVLLVAVGGAKIWSIMKSTEFDDATG